MLRFLRIAVAILVTCIAGYIAWDTIRMMLTLYHGLPFWDMWDFVADFGLYQMGEYRFWELWRQHAEHRLFFPRLLFFADFLYFNGQGAFLLVCNVVVQVVHAAALFYMLRRVRVLQRAESWILFGVLVGSLFASLQLMNFIWPFQVQFFLIYAALSASLACCLAHEAALREKRGPLRSGFWLFACLSSAVVANYSMANGNLVWPLLFLFALHARLPRFTILSILCIGGASAGFYIAGFSSNPSYTPPLEKLQSPLKILWYFSSLVGVPLKAFGASTATVVGGFATTAIAIGLVRFGWWRSRNAAESALIFYIGFLLATAALIAFGRMDYGPGSILASRYCTPVLLLWSCSVAWVLLRCGTRPETPTWRKAVPLVVAGGWMVYLGVIQESESRRFAGHRDRQSLAAMALLNGVHDEHALRKSHDVDTKHILRRAKILRKSQRSIFHRGWHSIIGDRAFDHFEASEHVLPHAGFDCVFAVDGDAPGRRVVGWAWDERHGVAFRDIILLDDDDRVLGFAEGGRGTSTAPPDKAVPLGARVGWQGYVRVPETQAASMHIHACAIDADGKTLLRIRDLRSTMLIRLAAPESLGAPVQGEVSIREGWAENGQYPTSPPPPGKGRVYGSWVGSDASQGELRIGPIRMPSGSSIGIPLFTGPDPSKASLEVLDATGRVITAWLRPPAPERWAVWQIDAPRKDGASEITIVARDSGDQFGQWFAIALPGWIKR